jgi:pyruvate formate lyase activating enzyme
MEMSGRQESVESIMKVIRKETLLMDQSGGGVTFSGGEPLQHPELLLGLLKACNKEGIHTAVDTCGHAETETLLEVAKYTDLFLYDLKHMDPLKHKEFTGVSNRLILENLQHLSEFGSRINIRIPLIDGFNADEGNIEATAKFVAGLPGEPKLVNLLPYHGIASAKYQKLGGIYDPGDSKEPGKEKVEKVISIFQKKGLLVSVGG